MKRVMWKENFIEINEDFLSDLKKEYYMSLGAYGQKLKDVRNASLPLDNNANDEQIKSLILSMLARRSTQGTEELEGYKPDMDKLEQNLYDNKLSITDESNVSLDIFRMYLNYDLPTVLDNETIKYIHSRFYSSKKTEYKSGRFRNKNDSDVMIKSSNKIFIESKNVLTYMNKFSVYLNALNEYDIVTKVAVLQGILLGIHPFKDGNGRVSRFIADKLISKELNVPLFLSEAINSRANDSSYYLALDAFHLNLDSNPLIRYFYEITIDQINKNIVLLENYLVDFNKLKEKLLEKGFKPTYAIRLSELLSTKTYFRNKEIKDFLDLTTPTSNAIIERLIKNKIIKKYKDQGRSILYIKY